MLQTGDFSPIASGDITEAHFQTDQGKATYNYIATYALATNNAEQYPSLATARNRLTSVELPDPDPSDKVGALAYEVVLDKLRADIRIMSTDLEIVSKVTDPLPELEKAVAKLTKMSEPMRRTKHMSLRSSISDILCDYDLGNILPEGVPWPWPSLTKATRGIHRKEFIVFAGRPKSRKTFVATEIGVRSFIDQGERVLFFSPEMPPRQIMLRAVASMAKVRYTEFKNGELDEAEMERLFDISNTFGSLDGEDEEGWTFRLKGKLKFPDKPPPSFDVIQSTGRDVAWMQMQIEIFKPSMIIGDSFYRQDGKKYDSDWKAVSAVSRRLKDITMDLNIMTIGTVQMNRGAQHELGDLSNISLADAIGQDADAIFRVLTGKIDGSDRSALLTLGGREIPFDGILINNKPCWDLSEIGAITDKQQVLDLMAKSAAEQAADQAAKDAKDAGKKSKAGPKRRNSPTDSVLAGAHESVNKKTDGTNSMGDLISPAHTAATAAPILEDLSSTDESEEFVANLKLERLE